MRTILSAAAALAVGLGTTAASAQTLQMWTTEEQLDRLQTQRGIAASFEKATGIAVEVIPVTESELGQRVTAAFAAGDLPDVIYHPLQYVQPWAEAGILDIDAATEVIEDIGEDSFAPGALRMADVDGDFAAVPVDGWTQMLLYRADLFEENGLAPPATYEAVLAAVEALHNPPEMFGFVAGTKVDEAYMSQMLEHVLLANGATPVGEDGISGFEPGPLREALEFYKAIADASPPGELYWQQSRELYFAGRAAMIIWSPFILDELAGLRDSAPPTINDDPTSTELASKTGVVTTLSGPSNPEGAAWAELLYLGITADANTDAAIEFVKHSMDEGYEATLSLAPEGKFPVRRGDAQDPERFVKVWQTLPVGVDRKAPLGDIYPASVIADITRGLDTAERWGVSEGELAAASLVVNSRIVNRIVRRYIDDEITVDEAVTLINDEIATIE